MIGLTTYQELWLNFVAPGILFAEFVIMWFVFRWWDRTMYWNYRYTCFSIIVLIYAQVSRACLDILGCREIEGTYYVWKAGTVECFNFQSNAQQIVLLIAFICVVCFELNFWIEKVSIVNTF